MQPLRPGRFRFARRSRCGFLLAVLAMVSSCKQAPKPEADKSVQMGMWLDSVPELKTLQVSNAEITELAKAHEAGLTDPSSVVLIRLARQRQTPFSDGQSIADLLHSGSSEATVLQLARLNQLGAFAGEARALRLTGLSDKVVLAVAERSSQGKTVLSGGKLGELKNTGVSEATILEMIQRGDSEETASKFIAARERAAGGHRFVFQTRSRR
jgi:hypothetical protein